MHKKGFSLNTIGKYTRTLKTLLGAAAKPKFGVNKYNHYLEYPVLEVESHNIALNKAEIDAMYKLDLADKPSPRPCTRYVRNRMQNGFKVFRYLFNTKTQY